jgi:pimeloyl-ACP methyl ester carboxylesterase
MTHRAHPKATKLGLAASATVAAVATVWVALRHRQERADAHCDDDFSELSDVTHRSVPASDGGEIHVADRGRGRPFVLLPGVTLTTLSWHYQLIDLVDAGYRVLAMDIRGHGRSIPGSGGYGGARLAEDVYEALLALDVKDAILVGHSLGGMTALQLLIDHPELASDGTVSGMVLVSTSASMIMGNGVPAALARAIGPIGPAAGRGHAFATTRRGQSAARRADLASLYCRLAFGSSPSRTHVEVVRSMTSAVAPEVLGPLIATLAGMDMRKLLEDISVPTLVVVGQRDMITPVWHSRFLRSHIPGAELVVLPGCGHLVLFERRSELSDLLKGWATQCWGSPISGSPIPDSPNNGAAADNGARVNDTA